MTNGLNIGNSKAIIIIVIGILALVGIILACGPQVRTPLPVSSRGDKYSYSYDPPEQAASRSVKITLAVVNPCLGGGATIDRIYSKVADGLAKSMAIDLDKIIIAKGMTATGPFEALDMMTYPDKKNADLSLTPEFLINVQSRDISAWERKGDRLVKTVEVNVDARIVLLMREPLSSEKIWIKTIAVDESPKSAEIFAETVDMGLKPGYHYVHQYGPGKILYDGRTDAVADIVQKMYPNIMQTTWRYINTDEVLVLKEKADEVRKLKRY
jgi:hypothetical protein